MAVIPTTGPWGSTLFGNPDILGVGDGTLCDVQDSLLASIYRLGFGLTGDFSPSSWVTPAELLQFADDAAKRLAWSYGLFPVVDTSIPVVPGVSEYALPAGHVLTSLIWISFGIGIVQSLRITPVSDLWALDANWPTTSGDARRVSLNAGDIGNVTLYPNPVSAGTLAQICQIVPAALVAGATTIALPVVLRDYFTYAMLAGAKGKESDSADAPMAQHYQARMDLYEQVMDHLWGPER